MSKTETVRQKRKDKVEDPDLKLYAIFPDYWKSTWGPKPCLGHVRAYSEFYARYKAYDKGLLTLNYTFGPEAVEMPKKEHKEPKEPKEQRKSSQ